MRFKSPLYITLVLILFLLVSCQKEPSIKASPLIESEDSKKLAENKISDVKPNQNNNLENKTTQILKSEEKPKCSFFSNEIKDSSVTIKLNNKFQNKFYSYQINDNWRDLYEDLKESFPGESYYSFEGRDFPAFYNEGPVTANVWSITETKYKDLEKAKEEWINGIKQNADRDFSKSPEMEVCKSKISSGEDAYYLKSVFFRKSKSLNYHRYDVLGFKDGKTYTITITIGYSNYFEEAEIDLNLDFASEKILTSLELK